MVKYDDAGQATGRVSTCVKNAVDKTTWQAPRVSGQVIRATSEAAEIPVVQATFSFGARANWDALNAEVGYA